MSSQTTTVSIYTSGPSPPGTSYKRIRQLCVSAIDLSFTDSYVTVLALEDFSRWRLHGRPQKWCLDFILSSSGNRSQLLPEKHVPKRISKTRRMFNKTQRSSQVRHVLGFVFVTHFKEIFLSRNTTACFQKDIEHASFHVRFLQLLILPQTVAILGSWFPLFYFYC